MSIVNPHLSGEVRMGGPQTDKTQTKQKTSKNIFAIFNSIASTTFNQFHQCLNNSIKGILGGRIT